MLGKYFYHKRIHKSVAAFGTLFNDIYVVRPNSSGGTLNLTKVPISYGPKDKFIERAIEEPDLDNQKVSIKLPRLSFEIVGISYDPTRQVPKMNIEQQPGSSNALRTRIYSPTPYIINFQLTIIAKNQGDALQIFEQIVPNFAPQYTLTMKPFDDYTNIKEDVIVTLEGATLADDYEGAVETRRSVIYTLDFAMKISFSGPINEGNVITKAYTELNITDVSDSDTRLLTITTQPDPLDATAEDDYGFTEIYDFEGQ